MVEAGVRRVFQDAAAKGRCARVGCGLCRPVMSEAVTGGCTGIVVGAGDGPCFDERAHVPVVLPLPAQALKSRRAALFIPVSDGAALKNAQQGCVVLADVDKPLQQQQHATQSRTGVTGQAGDHEVAGFCVIAVVET